MALAGVAGFEPTNSGFRDHGLTAWRHPNNDTVTHIHFKTGLAGKQAKNELAFPNPGEPSETRTPDTLIKSQVLYRLS